jgi:hypothetical protein
VGTWGVMWYSHSSGDARRSAARHAAGPSIIVKGFTSCCGDVLRKLRHACGVKRTPPLNVEIERRSCQHLRHAGQEDIGRMMHECAARLRSLAAATIT